MSNSADFVVTNSVIDEAAEAVTKLGPMYVQEIAKVKKASEELIDRSNWKGKARDEFKDTYRIVEHYLEDDSDRISSIGEILKGFRDIYEAIDAESMKKLYEEVKKAFKEDS